MGKFELIDNFHSVPITKEGRPQLKNYLQKFPLGREVHRSINHIQCDIPSITVHEISANKEYNPKKDGGFVMELDSPDLIAKNEPTYTEEADIKTEIIEAQGLEMPTQIFESAAEAVNLDIFPAVIQPFIKDIFLDKYPQVVALHAIDARDLSLTLRLTQLRLRPGELLPRCKRIFHMSPSDTRHLDDICDLLIRFGYLKRAPITPNNCHLYGMASYLVL